jgi:3-hydroxymyristoyl/3-hydroxydecanoyl-(acyl carrier protein) dehydratase
MEVYSIYDRSLIEIILPHRSPFLMVDSITSYTGGKNPSMLAHYTIKDNEPIYSNNESYGHLPSMYIIEGLGQCCNLLIVISTLEKRLMNTDLGINAMGEVLKKLMDDESDEITGILKDVLHQRMMVNYSNIGFLGSADVEITGHARQSQKISYEVKLNQVFGSLYHSTVRAYTENNLIARGNLVSSGRTD